MQGHSDHEDAILAHAWPKIRALQLPDETLPCNDIVTAHDGNEEEWPAQAKMAGQCPPKAILPISIKHVRTLDDGRQAFRQALRVAMQLIELAPLHVAPLVQCPPQRTQEQKQSGDRRAEVFALFRQASSVVDFLVFGPHGYETLS